MPGLLITAIIMAVVAAILLLAALFMRGKKYNGTDLFIKWPRNLGLGFTALTLVFLLLGSGTMVPTKEFGVVTQFGRVVTTLDNGFHWKAPWNTVTTIDAAIQTDDHKGDSCINVRIAYQANACINVSVSWRIRDEATNELFKDYRDFDRIKETLVTRELVMALTAEFGDYDPLAIDNEGNSLQSLTTMSNKITSDMQSSIGSQIYVQNVVLSAPTWSDNIQSKIDALQAQIAQTRIAEQSVKTNTEQALANQKLAASLSNDPNVLVSKCLDIVESGKTTLPAGFTCWPDNSSAVVVPSK